MLAKRAESHLSAARLVGLPFAYLNAYLRLIFFRIIHNNCFEHWVSILFACANMIKI